MNADESDPHRVLIVGGSGGVGKTSISAALALQACLDGHRTLLLTIDPARRLSAAMGIDRIGADATDITEHLEAAGFSTNGSLHAMMLDAKRTLDRIVENHARTVDQKKRILNNRLYRNVSTRLAGSQEYAAMQCLAEIADSGEYDRIIVDTPPSAHALDFLDAPRRLRALFDSRLVKVFIGFGSSAGRGFFRLSDLLFKALERLTGSQAIAELSEFFEVAESLFEPFNARSERANQVLHDPYSAFLIVTGPNQDQLEQAHDFKVALDEMGMQVTRFIVNRHLKPRLEQAVPVVTLNSDNPDLETRIRRWGSMLEKMAHDQADLIASLSEQSGLEVTAVPQMDEDIHSLSGLARLARHL
jgi:anion-transporting  ArsA/GET3 family ATPase